MKTIVRASTVTAAALMLFSLPVLAEHGTIWQHAERVTAAQVVDLGTINHGGGGHGGFSCYPFICG